MRSSLLIVIGVILASTAVGSALLNTNPNTNEVVKTEEIIHRACIEYRDELVSATAKGTVFTEEEASKRSKLLDHCFSRGYIPNKPIIPLVPANQDYETTETNSEISVSSERTTIIDETEKSQISLSLLDAYYETIYYYDYSPVRGIDELRDVTYKMHLVLQTDNPPIALQTVRLQYLPTGLEIALTPRLAIETAGPIEWISEEFGTPRDPFEFDVYLDTDVAAIINGNGFALQTMSLALRSQATTGSANCDIFVEVTQPLKSEDRRISIIPMMGCKRVLYAIEFYSVNDELLGTVNTNLQFPTHYRRLLPLNPRPEYVLVKSELGEWKTPIVEASVRYLDT